MEYFLAEKNYKNISVSISQLRESIKTHELTWINYLDENGLEASNDQIDETPIIMSEVKNGKFSIDATVSYPQLFTIRFKSERGRIASWGGDYFIDDSTSSIAVDSTVGCSELNEKTFIEYKNNFLPFLFGVDVTCNDYLYKRTGDNKSPVFPIWVILNS